MFLSLPLTKPEKTFSKKEGYPDGRKNDFPFRRNTLPDRSCPLLFDRRPGQ
jgi:hypothetical protein